MAGVNSTNICFDDASLQQCSSNIRCSHESVEAFHKTMGATLWQVNMLVLTDAVLAGVLVAIGAFAQRYRHHPFTRFIFLGATTLLLPITSYVVSTISTDTNDYVYKKNLATLAASCRGGFHYFTAVSWAFLIQITMINTCVIVAVDDREEGRNKGPPIQLLFQGLWTVYLGVHAMGPITTDIWQLYLELMLFAIICAKIVLKCYAFVKARKSFAFGRNPRLISGYMEQLQEAIQPNRPLVGEDHPPPLLVMGEQDSNVDMRPHGYFVNAIGLVTIDKVWQLNDEVFQSMRHLKDLCLSFSLFKLLRCRFVRYEHANDRSVGTPNFFWNFLLGDGNHERVFQVIADELSFIQDYYFSSLPVSYSKYWLPMLSVSISLLSITYCILATRFIIMGLLSNWKTKYSHQLRCHFWCKERHLISNSQDTNFGSFLFDDISLFFLIALVVIAEVRYIESYIFSNWTKVALICHYINHAALQHSVCMRKCFGFLLRCKWKLMKHGGEKMGQSSVLVVHPRRTALVLLRRLLCLPDLDRSVKIPDAVKVSIFDTLRHYRQHNWHQLGNGTESLSRSSVRKRFLLFCSRNSASDTILTWHIATCILELYQHGQGQGFQADSNHKVTATHLSRYCTYLMAWSPDLLPDDDEWSKSLYEAVKEDAKRALVGFSALAPESEYEQVVRLLSDNSLKNEVLRNGVRLAEKLVELTEGEAWMMLAEFWSEMILYIAPSENVRGHLGAIARGGELITLLWALLTHAGIRSWPADAAGTAIA